MLQFEALNLRNVHGNIRTYALQLAVDSSDEDPQVNCTVSIMDGGGAVTDTQALQFAVQANSPGVVRTTDLCAPCRRASQCFERSLAQQVR